MGYKGNPAFFRESLKHEDQVQQQIKDCREAFNLGDRGVIKNTVQMLQLLITEKMYKDDLPFQMEMEAIDKTRDKEYKKLLQAYDKECTEAGCPDVVDKPQELPNGEYFQQKFQACVNLFERRGLMFKERYEADLDWLGFHRISKTAQSIIM